MAHIRIIVPVVGIDGSYAALERDGITISSVSLETGTVSIEYEHDAAYCIPDTLTKIKKSEEEGVDAVIINCMGDPGLIAARELVKIPVLGPAQTSMHIASMLGRKFGILAVTRSSIASFEDMALAYGLASRLASVRSVDIPVLEIESDTDKSVKALENAAIAAVTEDRADVLILGCTGFLGFAATVESALHKQGLDVPVIDPLPATVNMADAILKSGLKHSKHAYMTPTSKPLVGYE